MSAFYRFLQERLNAHGERLDVDGDWGRKSQAALRRFQAREGLAVTGMADQGTVDALRRAPENAPASQALPERAVPDERMPPWMAELHRKMGLHEVRDNAVLARWLRRWGRFLGDPARLPWCGDAVESAIAKTLRDEPLPSNPFWAQAWNTFGIDAGVPLIGSIGVIRWSKSAGHVGFVAGVSGSQIHLLGGNQSNAINIRAFPAGKFLGFRWPVTFPVRRYPPLVAGAPSGGGAGATR